MRVDVARSGSFAESTLAYVGGALLALNLFFPPWMYTFQSQGISKVTTPAGYSAVFAPPAPRSTSYVHGIALDITRLVVQTVAISTVLAVGLAILRRRNQAPDILDTTSREIRPSQTSELLGFAVATGDQGEHGPKAKSESLRQTADQIQTRTIEKLREVVGAARVKGSAKVESNLASAVGYTNETVRLAGSRSGLAPEVLTLLVQIVQTYIKDGMLTFREVARSFQQDFPGNPRELDTELEVAWEMFRGEEVSVSDVLEDWTPEAAQTATNNKERADEAAGHIVATLTPTNWTPLDVMPLQPIELLMVRHWERFLPGLVRQLRKKGELELEIRKAFHRYQFEIAVALADAPELHQLQVEERFRHLIYPPPEPPETQGRRHSTEDSF